MALFNEILAGRFNKQLLKLFNMKGQAPAPQVGGDIIADVTLEQDRPEWGWLKGENAFSANIFITNAGAFNGRARLRLTAPNVLCVIHSIMVSSPSIASGYELYIGGASFNVDFGDVLSNVFSRDSRLALTPSTQWNNAQLFPLVISGENTTVNTAGSVIARARAPISQSVDLLKAPLMMSSRDLVRWPIGIDVRMLAANAQLDVTFNGTVRALEEGESTPA